LQQKGIAESTAQAALAEADLDDTDLAIQAGKRVASRYADLPWKDFLPKVGAYLQRRGFSTQIARTVSRQLWTDMQASRPQQNINEKLE